MNNTFNVTIDKPTQVVGFLKVDVPLFYQRYTGVKALKIVQTLYSRYGYNNYNQFLLAFNHGRIGPQQQTGPVTVSFELVAGEWFSF